MELIIVCQLCIFNTIKNVFVKSIFLCSLTMISYMKKTKKKFPSKANILISSNLHLPDIM